MKKILFVLGILGLAVSMNAMADSNDQKQLASFRKSLQEGDDTNCGLVIEKKAKLVKIQMKAENAEQWIKLNEIFPAGQDCSIVPKMPKPALGTSPAQKSILLGKKVCRNINTTYKIGYNTYEEIVKVSGFVENSSDNKIQVRISGMISNGSETRGEGDNVQRINGDVVLENGSVIWDESSNWANWGSCSICPSNEQKKTYRRFLDDKEHECASGGRYWHLHDGQWWCNGMGNDGRADKHVYFYKKESGCMLTVYEEDLYGHTLAHGTIDDTGKFSSK